jgi:hypothetical protein
MTTVPSARTSRSLGNGFRASLASAAQCARGPRRRAARRPLALRKSALAVNGSPRSVRSPRVTTAAYVAPLRSGRTGVRRSVEGPWS